MGEGTDAALPPQALSPDRSRPVILAVGLLAPVPPLPGELAQAVIVHTGWGLFSAALLMRVLPDAVLGPLCGAGFDIIELAERLEGLGFGGTLLVATGPLPDHGLVQREIAASCPRIPRVLLIAA